MTLGTSQRDTAKEKPQEMLVREACPRCHGSMMLDFDSKAGYYRTCINCGHIKYLHRLAPKLNQR